MKYIVIFIIKIYQIFISPIFPKRCIYYPTCSEYSKLSILKFGLIKGIILSINRIIRCNPFKEGGYDPVPDKFNIIKNKEN